MLQRVLLQPQIALGSYAEPGWASDNGWPAFADRLLDLARERARFRPSAGVRECAVHVGAVAPDVAVLATLLDNDPRAWICRVW